MQKTKSSYFFNTASLGQAKARVNYTNGYFERSQKRSPYSAGGYSAGTGGGNRRASFGFTLCAILLLFLVYPVGVVMIWNRRVSFTPGVKLLLTLLAAVVFCLALVYVANLKTNNPQLMKIQSGLNKAFDWIYDVFGSAFKKIGSWKLFRENGFKTGLNTLWAGTRENVARAGISLLENQTQSAAYVRQELPRRLLSSYKKAVGYKEPATAPTPASTVQTVVERVTPTPTFTPMPENTPKPTPVVTQAPAKVTLPEIRSAAEAGIYYNPGGTSYHIKSTCYNMFSSESHTLAEAASAGKVACQNCSVPSLELLSHEQTDYLWVDSKNVAHTSDLCVEFMGDYRLVPFTDVYEGHYTYCPKCKADTVYEYMRQNDTSYNVQYEELTQDEILLYEYEKTITVYYGENSRSYHSTQDCQQMYDEKYTHTLFEALHKDGKKPCSACNPYNEADAREYLDSLK
ncbi:MAG: hypothetical protein IJM56_03675 [Clostridia bacterium]|nr:hypothetical protein [Clostridia bacterium]